LGPFSDELIVGLIALPAKPALAPVRDEETSTVDTIVINWAEEADGAGTPAGSITGYRLYQAVGPSASFTLIFDGSGFRTVRSKI